MEKTFEKIWQNCLDIIKDNVNQQSFKTWFDPIRPVKLNGSVLTIQVPSQFFYEWLEEHYIDLLKKTINKELGPDGRLEYSIIMENNYRNSNPYTVNIPAVNHKALKNPAVSMPIDLNSNTIKNPFILP
ncbi:MAG TPA: DnaA N-terminal domain-containing protein, partial [Flavobacteriales bacterium]|nr:DnaA N-terminal domain-containing protein [Flavobacteriales bacterium]